MASLFLLIIFFLLSQSPPSISLSPLSPQQISALHSLHIPTTSPCTSPVIQCDAASPFRHVTSISLLNISLPSLSPLSSLKSLSKISIVECHVAKHLTGVFLSRFLNLTSLTVVNSFIKASGPGIIVKKMKKLENLKISGTNLTGYLPKEWKNVNLTRMDLSNNRLKGGILSTISELENLEMLYLSNNGLEGEIPSSIGDMVSLKNLSISGNGISGNVPKGMPVGLEYLDLGSNQLNGTIPHFISGMKNLKYLNLEKNNFVGVMPFNASFIKRLEVFKIGGNSNLCYNRSVFSAKKVKLGIAPCDKHGLPLSPPPPKDDGGGGGDGDDISADESPNKNKSSSHGPNKVVLGVAIGLSAVVFLIIFCVLVSKCCR